MMRELALHEGLATAAPATEARWHEMLGRPDVTVLVALVDGQAVGFVSAVRTLHLWTGGEIAALDDLFVHPKYRDAGVGEALVHALAARSNSPIRWELEEGNFRGQRFSLRFGARLRRKVVAWWEPTPSGDSRPRSLST